MTIMPFEGVEYPSAADEVEFIITLEPTHTDEDEAYYVTAILSGEADEEEADREGEYMRDEFYDEYESRRAGDRWESNFWQD